MIKQQEIVDATLTFWRLFERTPSPELFKHLTNQDLPSTKPFTPNPSRKINQTLIDQYLLFLRFIPGVVAVAVCNSHSLETDTEASDIDLFIVLKDKIFFTSRLLVTIYFQLLRLRRHGNKIKSRFCLSFFISEQNLNLKKVLLEKDIYFYYWFRTLQWYIIPEPFSDWQERWSAQNQSWLPFKTTKLFPKSKWQKQSQQFSLINKFLQLIEPINKTLQLKRAHAKNKNLGNPTGVIINPTLLKFHVIDRRPQINKNFWTLFKNTSK